MLISLAILRWSSCLLQSSCLPISTTSRIFVGSESRSTVLAASFCCGTTVHCQTYIGLSQRRGRRWYRRRSWQQSFPHFVTFNNVNLIFRLTFRNEVIHTGLGSNCCRSQGIIPVHIMVLIPIALRRSKRSFIPGFTVSFK